MAETSNRTSRPSPGTATGRVWEIADEITAKAGRRAPRADVIRRFQEEGGNYNTASTQYHLWKTRYEESRVGETAPAPGARSYSVQVKEGGRLVLPAELRNLLGIAEGCTLSVEASDGEIRLTPPQTAIRKAQRLVRGHIPEDAQLVDRMIEDRRQEDLRERSQ